MIDDTQFRWRTDAEIASDYAGFTVSEFVIDSDRAGGMQIDFPHKEDHWDNFIIYDNGGIAFDMWYPADVYGALCELVRTKMLERKEQKEQ